MSSLGLCNFSQHFVVVSFQFLALGVTGLLAGNFGALALEALRGDEALDLRGLEGVLLAFFGDLALDDVLADIVFFAEAEKLADFVRALRTQAAWACGVCKRKATCRLSLLEDCARIKWR